MSRLLQATTAFIISFIVFSFVLVLAARAQSDEKPLPMGPWIIIGVLTVPGTGDEYAVYKDDFPSEVACKKFIESAEFAEQLKLYRDMVREHVHPQARLVNPHCQGKPRA